MCSMQEAQISSNSTSLFKRKNIGIYCIYYTGLGQKLKSKTKRSLSKKEVELEGQPSS